MHLNINNCRMELLRGDITDQEVDAIVNAANASLAGGGGVDGAIHRRGGPTIMQETDKKHPNGCPTGSAVASGAGNLKAQFVFHAVGPQWRGGNANEPELLRSAYQTCLELAITHDCRSIAFPSISTGVYGYPIQQAAQATSHRSADSRPPSRVVALVARRTRLCRESDSQYSGQTTFLRSLYRVEKIEPGTLSCIIHWFCHFKKGRCGKMLLSDKLQWYCTPFYQPTTKHSVP